MFIIKDIRCSGKLSGETLIIETKNLCSGKEWQSPAHSQYSEYLCKRTFCFWQIGRKIKVEHYYGVNRQNDFHNYEFYLVRPITNFI